MKFLVATLLGVFILITGGFFFILKPIFMTQSELPVLQDVYWGPGKNTSEGSKQNHQIRPFKIQWDHEMISDLRNRLKNTRKLQPALEDVAWTYGIRDDFVSKIVDHWLNKYDFTKREAQLNRFPQYITNIQGLDIHFIHVKPELPKDRKIQVLPLLILHGWPGSVVEFQKVIPMLTTPRADYDFVFEVIAPSLPGYGYSDAAAKAGLGGLEVGLILKNLMLRIGFDKFYIQAGDFGAIITAQMSAMYPEHVLGMHSNMCWNMDIKNLAKVALYSMMPWMLPEEDRTMMFPLKKIISIMIEESGYFHMQATKPDTLGVGITDSPAGLAAYILEKFSLGIKVENKYIEDGNLLQTFTADELIDNLMFYWAPNKATSAARLYAESFNIRELSYKMDSIPIKVPSACARFPNEGLVFPVEFLKSHFVNLVHSSKPPRGGHFAAMEVPELLVDDVFVAVHKMLLQHAEKEREKKDRLEL